MSRKDFRSIAEAVAWTIGQDMSDHPEHDTMQVLIGELIYQLRKLNPLFDEDKFRDYIETRAIEVRDNLNEFESFEEEVKPHANKRI